MKKSNKSNKKLTSIPIIKRRLFRLVSQICRENANFTCEICGIVKGQLYKNKPQHVECHHVMSRKNKGSPLQYDLRNLCCLCSYCHKHGKFSAHKHALWFAKWFIKMRPIDADWIIEHTNDVVDLDDRRVLEIIENCLIKKLPLDLNLYNVIYLETNPT